MTEAIRSLELHFLIDAFFDRCVHLHGERVMVCRVPSCRRWVCRGRVPGPPMKMRQNSTFAIVAIQFTRVYRYWANFRFLISNSPHQFVLHKTFIQFHPGWYCFRPLHQGRWYQYSPFRVASGDCVFLPYGLWQRAENWSEFRQGLGLCLDKISGKYLYACMRKLILKSCRNFIGGPGSSVGRAPLKGPSRRSAAMSLILVTNA